MNWVLIIELAAAFCVGVAVGIWIDNCTESEGEW